MEAPGRPAPTVWPQGAPTAGLGKEPHSHSLCHTKLFSPRTAGAILLPAPPGSATFPSLFRGGGGARCLIQGGAAPAGRGQPLRSRAQPAGSQAFFVCYHEV